MYDIANNGILPFHFIYSPQIEKAAVQHETDEAQWVIPVATLGDLHDITHDIASDTA